MATMVRSTERTVPAVLSPDDARAFFDRQARRLAGISGEQFIARWDAGEFRDLPDTAEGRKLGYLLLLLPFGRQ